MTLIKNHLICWNTFHGIIQWVELLSRARKDRRGNSLQIETTGWLYQEYNSSPFC
jgi:hypothetical protein